MTAPPNPYVGPRTFTEKEKNFFFGREREARDLTARIVSERLLLFYAQSGAGKSSLLNARVIPRLRDEERFQVLPVGRVSGELPAGIAGVDNIYAFNLMASLDQGDIEPERLIGVTLSDFLARLAKETALDDAGRRVPRWVYKPELVTERPAADEAQPAAGPRFVLIIDQFEEIITGHPGRWREREDFFRQLNRALLDDPNLWVVLTLREDYVAALDPYAELLINRLRARFYMERMSVAAGLDAIRKPAALAGRPFAEGVAEKLVDDLRQVRIPGQRTPVPAQYVEPVQLQVVCYQLWENLVGAHPDGRPAGQVQDLPLQVGAQITFEDLAAAGDVDRALTQFYEETLALALADPAAAGVSERQLRAWFGEELITEAGTRGLVHQGEESTGSLPNAVISPLQRRFLVRAEARGGDAWIELVHDRFVEPIRASNTAWFPLHLSTLQRQAALWDEQRRPNGLLLSGQALLEAEEWTAAQSKPLEPHEEDFLAACRAARENRRKQKRQNLMIRWLAAGAAVFSIITALLAWNSFRQLGVVRQERQRAETAAAASATAEAIAEARRVAAESAQATAERERDRAEQQSQIARSRQAAAIASDALRRGEGVAALLSAVTSYRITDTIEAENVMHQALVEWRGAGVLGPQESRVSSAQFSPDGRIVATVAQQVVYLWEVAGERRTLALRGHTRPVTDLKWSPDGRFVATVSRDGTGRLWDRKTGAEVWQALVPQEGIAVAFHPDGRTVAFGGDDGKVTVWQTEPLSRTAVLAHGSWGYPIRLQYSPDGQLLAGAYADETVRVWRSGQMTELRGHQGVVWDVAFSPDGQLLASRGSDDTVRLWRAESGELVGVAGGARELEPRIWFSPDSRYIAATSRAGVAYLWDTTKLAEPPFVLAGHSQAVTALAFSPDGRTLATTSFDKTARLWDVETKTSKAVLVGHTDIVWWATFSPEGNYLVTTSSDKTARLWDPHLDEGGELAIRRYGGPTHLAGLSADGDRVVAVQDGTTHVWHLRTQQEQVLATDLPDVRAVAFDPKHSILAIADGQGQIVEWDIERATQIATLAAEEGVSVRSLAFEPTGGHLAVARQNGTVQLWNQVDGTLALTLVAHQNDVTAVSFSPNAALLASGSGAEVKLWDWRRAVSAGSGSTADRSFEVAAPVWAVAFSSDGLHLAAALAGGEIWVWDLRDSGDAPAVRLAGTSSARALAFNPGGDRLAAGDEQGDVNIWRWREGSAVRLTGHRRWVTEIAYHPDGQRLITAGQDGTVRAWPATPELTVRLVCERVGDGQAASASADAAAQACAGTPGRPWIAAERLPAPQAPIPERSMVPQPGLPVIYYFEAVPGTRAQPGQPIWLRWDLANATAAYLYEGDTRLGIVAPAEREFRPEKTTTYRLVVQNDLGEVERTLTVTIEP